MTSHISFMAVQVQKTKKSNKGENMRDEPRERASERQKEL